MAAFSFGATSAVLAAADLGSGSTSPNWAGHAAQAETGGSYNLVSASWVEPGQVGACNATSAPSLALIWVGFDGHGSKTNEQVGVALQCVPTGPGTFGFTNAGYWQGTDGHNHVLCNPPSVVNTPTRRRCDGEFLLEPGDEVTATLSYADGAFTFRLHNARTDQTFTNVDSAAGAPRASAEAILESPRVPCVAVPGCKGAPMSLVQAPLLNFGTVSFTHFHEGRDQDGAGHPKALAITMTTGTTVRAVPSKVDGSHFTVTWEHA